MVKNPPANSGDMNEFNPCIGDPLEEETATQSSIPVWEIPWTEKPGGLQSRGS